MKYAILITDSELENNPNLGINVGGVFMKDAVASIYEEMGIKRDDLIPLRFCDLENYFGEKVVLPVCIHIPISHGNERVLRCSPNIKPVFLSLSMSATELKESEIVFLKKNEPIGCRDDQTYHTIKKYNINCFIMGDMVLCTPHPTLMKLNKKIVFSDVPTFAQKYIPQDVIDEALFVKQEILFSELPNGYTPLQYAEYIKNVFYQHAKLVITSRFHAAALAAAYNIPYILINEAFTFRFSWFKKLGNFYTRDNINELNINPLRIDFSSTVAIMKSVAKKMLQEGGDIFADNDFSPNTQKLTEFFSYKNWENVGEIDYYDEAINYIEQNWEKNEVLKYSFWGVNKNAEIIYQYINKNYPFAKLYKIYDGRRRVVFHNINSESPDNISNTEFVFVTTFTAKGPAQKLFLQKRIDKCFICDRTYIKK